MGTNERTNTDKNTTASNDAGEQNTNDSVQHAAGDAGGGSNPTGGISAGVGGTNLPAEEVNKQRRETPGGKVSKRDDNIKID